ncbi:beta strand repeat-containing protein [Campylobacter concisus]|uniref:beta strand repeat-containing protein n=3 Tax=Campylobacter concisus TaxID=199 RepID=UPI000CD937AC|nr:retention module-containing protein [Campylobacter concisus]
MAKEAGVVKSVNGGIARALNDLTGEVRQLSVGDIVYQGEKIVTEGSNSKVTITQTDGKDITLIGKDTLTLDQDSNNNETVADISALQQAILKGTDLNALEETAAGGPQAGGNGGDGVSLSSTSFAEGGHISNINANVGSIDALALAAGGDNSFGVSGGSAVGAGAIEPTLPAGSIKIPLSAYLNENINDGFVFHMRSLVNDMSNAGSTLNGYSIVRWIDGRDYLVPNAGVNTFTFQDGWFKSNDGKLAIGQDNAKDLVLTSSANSANHTGDVAKIVNPSSDLSVFGGDNGSKITSDGANIDTKIYSSVKGDEINITSDVTGTGTYEIDPFTHEYIGGQSYISTGSSSDNLNIAPGVTLTNTIINMGAGSETVNLKGTATDKINFKGSILMTGADNDVINIENASFDVTDERVSVIDGGSGNDTINVNSGAELKKGTMIKSGSGNDTINVNSGANIHGTRHEGALIHMGKSASPLDKGEQGNTSELNVKNGAFMSNAKIEVVAKENTINFEKGATTTGVNIIAEDVGTKSTINIKTDLKKSVEGRRSSISTGAGDDIVNVSDKAELTSVRMNLGEGLNKVTIDDATMNGGSIENGNGGNEITLTNNAVFSDAYISTGDGVDQVNVYDGALLNFAEVNTGGGNDIIRFEHLTTNPLQGYSYSAATQTEINMGDGEDTVVLTGMGNSGNYAGRVSDFQQVNINMGDGDTKHVQINRGKVETTNITTGSKDDRIEIQDDSLMEGRNNIETGAGVDEVYITDSKLNGTASAKTKIDTGVDGDHVVIRNSTLKHAEINTGTGVDTVDIEDEVTLDGTINTGADDDEVNIKGNITAATQANIKTGAGSDTINIDSGVTLTHTVIEMGAGEDTIEISGMDRSENSTDRITFKGSTLYTDDAGYTANDIDHVTISNTTFMKSDDGRLSSVQTGGGNDEITIKDGTIFQDLSSISAGNGIDTINLESGAKFNQANVYADAGDDIINVNGAEFKGENAGNHNAGIHGGDGNDKIFVNSGKFDNARIEGDAGNDTIHIKAGARFENSSIYGDDILNQKTGNDTIIVEKGATLINTTINGGAGYDTLKIADDSVNLTKVTNIEKLDLTEGDHNMTLTAKDVLDMTDSNNRLRIDGDRGDNLGLASKGWVEDTSANITGYKVYTNTDGVHTVTLEVQDQVHVF